MNSKQFILKLARNDSWTKVLYEEHLKNNEEVLPHILMEELSVAFLRISDALFVFEENMESNLSKITKFLSEIEDGMILGNDEVENVIVLSFLENINPKVKSFSNIKQLMGESTRAELDALISLQYGKSSG